MLVTYDTPGDAKFTTTPLRSLAAQTVYKTLLDKNQLVHRDSNENQQHMLIDTEVIL